MYMYVELLYETNGAIMAGIIDGRDWQVPLSNDRLLNLFSFSRSELPGNRYAQGISLYKDVSNKKNDER